LRRCSARARTLSAIGWGTESVVALQTLSFPEDLTSLIRPWRPRWLAAHEALRRRFVDHDPSSLLQAWHGSLGRERPRHPADEFVARAAGYLGVSLEDLAGRTRRTDVVRAREVLATLGVERYGQRVADLASVLEKHPESVSRCISRGTGLRRSDTEFEKVYIGLDQKMAVTPSRSGGLETS